MNSALPNVTLHCNPLAGKLRPLGEREPASDPLSQHILQRMAVQCRHEIAVRIGKNRLERARRKQGTVPMFLVEAFDDIEAIFHVAHHITEVDHAGRT